MAESEEKKKRKRVVVEEVTDESPVEVKPSEEIVVEVSNTEEVATDTKPEESAQPIVEEPKAPEPDQVVPPPAEYKEKRSFNVFFFFLILFFAFLITVFIGGIYVYFNGTKTGDSTTLATTPTPLATTTPEATPEASPEAQATAVPTNFKISILNGSGKSGEAGRAKAMVEKAGFNVESTGNANAFNFTDTQIQVKSGVPAETVTKLKESLSESYTVVDGKALDAKSQFDIVITVGSKPAN